MHLRTGSGSPAQGGNREDETFACPVLQVFGPVLWHTGSRPCRTQAAQATWKPQPEPDTSHARCQSANNWGSWKQGGAAPGTLGPFQIPRPQMTRPGWIPGPKTVTPQTDQWLHNFVLGENLVGMMFFLKERTEMEYCTTLLTMDTSESISTGVSTATVNTSLRHKVPPFIRWCP
jgi:hypothetical protein